VFELTRIILKAEVQGRIILRLSGFCQRPILLALFVIFAIIIYSCHAVEDNCTEGQHVFSLILSVLIFIAGGTRWRSWLRHCAASRKVAGSMPGGVIGIFHWHNPSGRTMALGLTQLLKGMSTRNISWG
jgi:hypothetical protein